MIAGRKTGFVVSSIHTVVRTFSFKRMPLKLKMNKKMDTPTKKIHGSSFNLIFKPFFFLKHFSSNWLNCFDGQVLKPYFWPTTGRPAEVGQNRWVVHPDTLGKMIPIFDEYI